MKQKQKIAVIIGAGPAGLTAAYELLDKNDIKPIILEKSGVIGGISQTINYKGNRIDIGGHRFFSKSNRIMRWWQNILPLQGAPAKDDLLLDRNISLSREYGKKELKSSLLTKYKSPDPEKTDKVLLNRSRVSRIFFIGKFFDYPISLNIDTLYNLGIIRTVKIGMSYLKTVLIPKKDVKSLEEFFINRFGWELYLTFFKDYTEKLWGVSCCEIKADWGAQRIKGLSIKKTLSNAFRSKFYNDSSLSQKNVETSLIEQFMYPKLGPGQMWEEVADIIKENGGEIHLNQKVVGFETNNGNIVGCTVFDKVAGKYKNLEGDYFLSTMPVCELIESFKEVPYEILEVAKGLMYRDFITVGLLLKKLIIKNQSKIKTINNIVPDNWIYIQEHDVKLGRLQIFNNWSPYLVKDLENIWIGLEYFCNEGDNLWNMSDTEFKDFATGELVKIGIINRDDVMDGIVIKVEKTYPAYFGTYDRFNMIREFTDKFENLFLIGRNGMHRYNNMDHSMLNAMVSVENIINGVKSKENIWFINEEEDYHEE
ncbi:MAG: NAD(P)/FAD-dependent oxidoreductase [Methanobacterium sp.]|nr:NAD(P)/FAD-dependent oxidoreductase [Methanobacterium sp.]